MSHNSFSMPLQHAAIAVSGEAIGEDVPLQGVSTDTRQIQPGELFVALQGPNFDGHDYLQQARDKGAVAALVSRRPGGQETLPLIVVDDTRLALGRLANAWRRRLKPTLVAVTGSNGKTTVKEMLASIFGAALGPDAVLATHGNLNNDIGVPLTLLRLNAAHRIAIIEMGANHAGEIAYLTGIAEPDVGVITNAAAAHLEGFGSLLGVARAKGELFAGLPKGSRAIINADDAFAADWREIATQQTVTSFGLIRAADVQARWQHGPQGNQVAIETESGSMQVHIALLGTHSVMNALAATATALALDVSLSHIKAGLETMQPVPGRLQLKAGYHGSRVIDDTYNANPASLAAALNALKDFPGKHLLALGEMAELGPEAEAIHSAAGRQALERGVDDLYALGKLAAAAAGVFGSARVFDSHDAIVAALKKELDNDVTLLVKGSRRSHMERVVVALTEPERLEV